MYFKLNRIRGSCERRAIEAIFHYTLVDNLPSILGYRGILCRVERRKHGLVCDEHGWGPSDRAEELKEYVSCSLEPPYGMIQAELDTGRLVLCEIDASVIWEEGTLFCPAWSSHHRFDLEYLKSHATADDFDQMFPNPFSSEPRFLGAEILVRNKVPLGSIKRVYFSNDDSMKRAIHECTQVVEQKGHTGVTIYFVKREEVFKRPPDHYLRRRRYRADDE